MQNIIIDAINHFGYLGLALLIALETVFPPIPSEVILTFGGFMTTYSSLHPVGVILSATLGSLVGALILYFVGRSLTPERLESFFQKPLLKRLHFKAADVEKARRFFQKRGSASILWGRCVPVVRSLISLPAGMAKMKLPLFIALTVLGSLFWNTLLVGLGMWAGESWEVIAAWFDTFSTIVVVALALLAIGAFFFWRRRQKRAAVKEQEPS